MTDSRSNTEFILQEMRESVVEAMLRLPNVSEYVRKVEQENERLTRDRARLRAQLAFNGERSMIDEVVVDVEIQKGVGQDGLTWDDTDKMGVAVAVVYEYKTDRFRIFGPNDVEALKRRLLEADRITGYNTWSFDFPVIWGLPRRTRRVTELEGKSNDLLRRIWKGMAIDPDSPGPHGSGGCKLDDVVRMTLGPGVGKIASGAQAPIWFQSGEWAKLVNYCIDDVALERDLGRFIDERGYVVIKSGDRVICKG